MNEKIKRIVIFRYAVLFTLMTSVFLSITLFLNNQLIDFLLLFLYFFTSFILLNSFHKQLENIILQEVSGNKKNDKKTLTVNNLAEWTAQTNKEIEQLKANEQFRKEFIGNVAHELKTPIFNIQGYITTLLDGAINDPKVNIEFLKRTDKNVDRLIALVADLDTISKLETGQMKPQYSNFELNEVVKEIFEILDIKAQNYGVKLINNLSDGILVKADKEKITEVIHNLVLNSIIYGRRDGYTKISSETKGEKVFISVEDNGIGINSKHLPHIFERFYRVDKSRSRERGGSGLGLSIVKHIIDSHNETINVSSQEGVGTKFIFSLSLAE